MTADQRIELWDNRRVATASAVFFGVMTAVAVGGIANGQVGACLLLLALMGPAFVLALIRVLRRGPVLVLEPEHLVDARRDKRLRWDAVTDARVSESRGLFSTYHELSVSGVEESRPTSESDPRSGSDSDRNGTVRIKVATIDQLTLPQDEITKLVEERLPATITLKREPARRSFRRRT